MTRGGLRTRARRGPARALQPRLLFLPPAGGPYAEGGRDRFAEEHADLGGLPGYQVFGSRPVEARRLFWYRWIAGHQISFSLWRIISDIVQRHDDDAPSESEIDTLVACVDGYSAMLLYSSTLPRDHYHAHIRPRMALQHPAFSSSAMAALRSWRGVRAGRAAAHRRAPVGRRGDRMSASRASLPHARHGRPLARSALSSSAVRDRVNPITRVGAACSCRRDCGPLRAPVATEVDFHEGARMDETTQVVTRPRDPLAAALGNASLLGVGYLMSGRKVLALINLLVVVTFVAMLATMVRSAWFEVTVLLWWVTVVVHGWVSAGGRLRRPRFQGARKRRLAALALAVPVLAGVVFLRVDAAGIGDDIARARARGDCPAALDALDARSIGHRVVNAPLAVRDDRTVPACERARVAISALDKALTGDIKALESGFGGLSALLADFPDHEQVAAVALNRFVAKLPTGDPCHTKAITDRLRDRKRDGTLLDMSSGVVPGVAPTAIVECADRLMKRANWTEARAHYQQLLNQYPDHALKARAAEGAQRATHELELATVRSLLATKEPNGQPSYCTSPASYSAAVAHGAKSPNPALLFGNDAYANRLPAEWRASEAANAVLVICLGESTYGAPVRTCPYRSERNPNLQGNVTFHRVAIPVRVFEVRSGKLLNATTVEIGGASCPTVIEYSAHIDAGPPPQMHVAPSDADVHAAFRPLISP